MSGKRTYEERYIETSSLSDDELETLRKQRENVDKPCGVIYRVQADREDARAKCKRHLLKLTHYLVLNLGRAKMVHLAKEPKWSSYQRTQ